MELITKSQIERNLRRTASKGLISLLPEKQLKKLWKKYFGIIEDKKTVGYYCPYSGLEIRRKEDLILEHIIPVTSGGGTTLFNCVPAHIKINGSSEKGAKHLLEWWLKSEYFDEGRLENLLNYIFEAYDLVFENTDTEDLLTSYRQYIEEITDEKADLSTTQEEEQEKLNRQTEQTGLIKYHLFLLECIEELKRRGKDTTKIDEKLQKLINEEKFKELEKYQSVQNSLKEIFKEKIAEDDIRELTIVLNCDIFSITKSLKNKNTKEEIYNELLKRVNNIEEILEQNDISLISYLEDINNCTNILALPVEKISNFDIQKLVNSVNLCTADKFNKLCEFAKNHNGTLPSMASKDETEKKLGRYRNSIQGLQKISTGFNFGTRLSKEQLEYLHNSEYESLRGLYKVILNKAIENNIELDYYPDEYIIKEGGNINGRRRIWLLAHLWF